MQGGFNFLFWILILVVFYFILILPEQKKQKKMKSMIESLKVGDYVMTRAGIYGTIVSMNENTIIVETGPDKVKLSMSKYSVSSIMEKDQERQEEQNTEANTVINNEENKEEKAE